MAYGGLVFALGLILLGIICLHELYTMTERVRPVKLAGFLGLAALILCAHYGDQFQILLALALTRAVTFLLVAAPARARERVVGDRGDAARACCGSAWRWLTQCCCASSTTAARSCWPR